MAGAGRGLRPEHAGGAGSARSLLGDCAARNDRRRARWACHASRSTGDWLSPSAWLPAVTLAGQQPTGANQQLSALDPFIGRWQGTSEGQPGKGTVEREYTRMLNSRFVQVKNRSVYPAQEKNPKGETARRSRVFSVWTRSRKRIVFRQFHVEGFVNQYVMEPATADRTLVFVTEVDREYPELAGGARDVPGDQRRRVRGSVRIVGAGQAVRGLLTHSIEAGQVIRALLPEWRGLPVWWLRDPGTPRPERHSARCRL